MWGGNVVERGSVIGMVGDLNAASAAQAEWVVLPASATAHAPKTVSAVHASTIPLNALTADQALDVLDLRPGPWVRRGSGPKTWVRITSCRGTEPYRPMWTVCWTLPCLVPG